MNAVDASEHYNVSSEEPPPSLLTIILDTNPHAWAALESTLPFSRAVANILVFINAHLASSYSNQVAVIASHTSHAQWLYPSNTSKPSHSNQENDTEMLDAAPNGSSTSSSKVATAAKYLPFKQVEEEMTSNLETLLSKTQPSDLSSTSSSMIAGALTLALSYINRQTLAWQETHGGGNSNEPDAAAAASSSNNNNASETPTTLSSRILLLSVSSTTSSASQYIPIMNSIFACQRLRIPIDICKVSGDAVFLQQAADATKGIYMPLSAPQGLLQYLLMTFLPDQRARSHLIEPSRVDVDFRAACFCHRRIVDLGYVCSICLSIFCEPPPGAECLTCGAVLQRGNYGAKPVVLMRKKKKKKTKIAGGSTGTSTPAQGGTPRPS